MVRASTAQTIAARLLHCQTQNFTEHKHCHIVKCIIQPLTKAIVSSLKCVFQTLIINSAKLLSTQYHNRIITSKEHNYTPRTIQLLKLICTTFTAIIIIVIIIIIVMLL